MYAHSTKTWLVFSFITAIYRLAKQVAILNEVQKLFLIPLEQDTRNEQRNKELMETQEIVLFTHSSFSGTR